MLLMSLFQIYDITLCDISCDYGHMPLHQPRNKRKRKREIKSKKIDKNKIKIKYKSLSIP